MLQIRKLLFCLVFGLWYGTNAFNLTDILYVSNGTSILRLTGAEEDQVNVTVLSHQDGARAVGVAIDVRKRLLFYSDVSPNYRGIYRISLDKDKGAALKIIEDVGIVNGLGIDWSSRLLYWTDEKRQSIEVCDYAGKKRHLLVDEGLMWPRGILADPVNGWLYWGDQGERRIERCRLDGSDRTVLADSSIDWPNQLALDYKKRRLFWVDAYNEVMMTMDLDDIRTNDPTHRPHRNYSRTVQLSTIYGMALSHNQAYFTTWDDGGVHVTTLSSKGLSGFETVKSGLGVMDMFSLVVDDVLSQPEGPQCVENNGGCSHLCFTTSRESSVCACPTYSNLILSSDNKTCTAVDEFLLYTDKSEGIIGFITLPTWKPDPLKAQNDSTDSLPPHFNNSEIPTGDTPLLISSAYQKHILARSLSPIAVAYDPVEEYVYWSDVKECAINRIRLTNGRKENFLNITDGIGTVDGLSIDWRHKRLYFTNRGNSRPKADGAVYSWQRVEMISLDKRYRQTLTSIVDKPRAIVVDTDQNYIYYTDWGLRPLIVKANLDGSDATVISKKDISNPNGLALQDGILYVADSNYERKTRKKHIAQYDTNRNHSSWSNVDEFYYHLRTPFSIAVTDHEVFVSDWRESHIDGVILVKNRLTGAVRRLDVPMKTPTGLYYVNKRTETPVQELDCDCKRGVCFPLPSGKNKCVCPDSSANYSCQVVPNYAIFCDLNTIKMINLDDIVDYRTVFYGSSDANFVALALDKANSTIYYSDLTQRAIFKMSLPDGHPTIFHLTDDPVDGLTFDADNQLLLWTAYNELTYEGYIAQKSSLLSPETDSKIVIRNLHRPRAVTVIDGFIFWTQIADPLLKSTGHVFKANLSSYELEVLNETRLLHPNALAIGNGHLYVGDGHYDKIDIYPFDGCQKLQTNTIMGSGIDHVFGLALYKDLAIFTSWHSNTIRALNISSHNITTLKHRLYRPTAVVIRSEQVESSANESCGMKNLFEKAVPPVLHNCPTADIITLQLPADSNSTLLPFTVFATDYNHQNLSLTFNNIPFGISTSPSTFRITRQPTSSSFTQFITFTATDNIGKSTTCSFSIKLVDKEPPCFVNCPPSLTIYSASPTAVVTWPEPHATDNVGVQAVRGPAKRSGSLFAVGATYTTTYSAVDWDGNNSTCSFDIQVMAKKSMCPLPGNFMQPQFGSLHCAGTESDYQCITTCLNTHVLNSDENYHKVSCRKDGTWKTWFPDDHYRLACQRKSQYRVIRERFQYWLPENCNQMDGTRRQLLTSEEKLPQVESVLTELQHKLEEFFSDLDLVVEDMVIPSHNGQLEAQQYTMDCQAGSVKMDDACVLCPSGYYDAGSEETCTPCPANTYQDQEGSRLCLQCPNSLLSFPSAYNVTMCMSGQELHPPPDKAPLVIGVVVAVILVASITLFLLVQLYKRRKHNKKMYRVADHAGNVPDPALESLSGGGRGAGGGGHIISNGKVVMEDFEQEEATDSTIMTVTFSPSGSRLQTETNLDVD